MARAGVLSEEAHTDSALSAVSRHVMWLGASGTELAAAEPSASHIAIVSDEFHSGLDWRGMVSEAEWAEIRAGWWIR